MWEMMWHYYAYKRNSRQTEFTGCGAKFHHTGGFWTKKCTHTSISYVIDEVSTPAKHTTSSCRRSCWRDVVACKNINIINLSHTAAAAAAVAAPKTLPPVAKKKRRLLHHEQ